MKKLVVRSLPGRSNYRIGPTRKFRGRHLFLILVLAGLGFVSYKHWYRPNIFIPGNTVISAPEKLEIIPGSDVPSELTSPAARKQDVPEQFEIRHHIVNAGETIVRVLESYAVSGNYPEQWEKACKSDLFANMSEGDELIVFLAGSDKQPVRTIYSPSNGPSYALRKSSAGWECRVQEPVPKKPVRTVHGRYAENFYDSCIAGGLPATLISNLADIFSYDIDITTELRDGDSFTVFFQEQQIEGKEGKQYLILAAEMTVSGKTYQAFGFEQPESGWDYFDYKGASLERAFLKSPLSYRKLISPSTYKNVKPVLKIYRPHPGIDYAAPKGTPVSSIGDGVITSLNKTGKSAVSIEVRHRGGYKSLYRHLSGYSRGLQRGGIVSRGEVIGSVGADGSGKTFLDFQFYKNKKPVKFHSIDFPRSEAIPKNSRADFEKTRDTYLAALRGAAGSREAPSGRN